MKKRISALLLSVVLCLGMLSTGALAVELGDDGTIEGVTDTTRVIVDGEVVKIIETTDGKVSDSDKAYIESFLGGSSTVQVDGAEGLITVTKPTTGPGTDPEGPGTTQPEGPGSSDPVIPVIPWGPPMDSGSTDTTTSKPSQPAKDPDKTPNEEPGQTPDENPPAPAMSFADVKSGDWFYGAVQYVFEKGIMTGDGSVTTFNPKGSMTRAMVWTVLGRLSGADVSGSGGAWYAAAQSWAVSAGVSDGSNPNGSITREELVTMLWRYAGSPTASANLGAFSDSASVSGWANAAVQWAVSAKILAGDNGRLNPGGSATRAEVATILMRYCEIIAE